MLVTLFTDASHDEKLVCSGWGSWARSERMEKGAVLGGWTTDPRVRGSTQAELYGVLMAVNANMDEGFIPPGDTVLVQCDCMAVEHMLEFISFPQDDCGNMLKTWLKQLRGESRLSFRYKHVEGHKSPLKSTRHGVNNLVDTRARQGLEAARMYVKTGKTFSGSKNRVS